ncbi:hypothetical protein HKX48_004762 [Thoreauomyces humboldtii]|nr:hypothetical protein HKX48_004762 [Thoreauomyces humboldtii]
MGCDGGSIPKRYELVKVKKAVERADPRMQLIVAWFFCALSKQPLVAPVVADAIGRLYNKDAVLEFLLANRTGSYGGDADVVAGHIESFKDVVSLVTTPNPLFLEDGPAGAAAGAATAVTPAAMLGNVDERPMVSRFVCPITGREMNGKTRFSYLANCGCVMADQALKNVPTMNCIVCNTPYDAEDVVSINPTAQEEVQRLKDRMAHMKERRTREAEERKRAKKDKKKKSKEDASVPTIAPDGTVLPALRTSSGSEEDDAAIAARKLEKKAARKRRHAAANDGASDLEDDGQPVRKRNDRINMVLPDLTDRSLLPKGMRLQSDAIRSLYKKDENAEEPNFLVRGTFNRFAAGF